MINSKYELIIEDIKRAINSGKVLPKQKISSENQLAEKYGVSRQTVRKALSFLIDNGYLYAVHGSGTFVAERKVKRKHTNNSRKGEAWCMEELLSKDIDGMIIEPSQSAISCQHQVLYQQMDTMGIPYVFIQSCYEEMMDRPHKRSHHQKGCSGAPFPRIS